MSFTSHQIGTRGDLPSLNSLSFKFLSTFPMLCKMSKQFCGDFTIQIFFLAVALLQGIFRIIIYPTKEMCGDKGMCFRATWAEIKSMQKPKVELSLPTSVTVKWNDHFGKSFSHTSRSRACTHIFPRNSTPDISPGIRTGEHQRHTHTFLLLK